MNKVLLNGKFVEANIIDTNKHKFIGLFRTPAQPETIYYDENNVKQQTDVYLCPCGQMLWTTNGIFDHWRHGHMDIPQYIDIDKLNIN
jgi:hypothetical protein